MLEAIDPVLPNDMQPRRMADDLASDLPVWIATLLAPGLYWATAWWVARSHVITPFEYLGAILSLGWMSVVPLVPSSHELYHARAS